MKTLRERGIEGAQARDRLHLALSKASFVEFERAFLAHERERLKSARGDRERLEVKRRTAEDILMGAYGRPCSWREFSRALRRVERLGYTNAGKRAEVATLFALSMGSFPQKAPQARRMLDDAERHLRRVRKTHLMRREWMREIHRVRKMTGWRQQLAPRKS